MAMSNLPPALELRGVDMHYGYVRALDAIDIHVNQGEVLGLVGDNGAGKSSLLKVMSGAHQPTRGTILVHGTETVFHSPSDSTAAGIQMVYQDLALVDPQDVATNLHIGREIRRWGPLGWLGFIDHKAQRKRSEAELEALGVDELLLSAALLPQPPGLAYFLRGFLAVLQYDPATAAPVLDRAVAAARAAGHVSLESLSLGMAAIAEHMAGDRAACRRLLDAAEVATAGLGYPETIMLLQARTLTGLFDNDLDTAGTAAAEGIRLSREAGDLYSLEMMLLNLGCAILLGGDVDGAEPLFAEALRLARDLDDRVGQYCLLDLLGYRAAETGRPAQAARLLGAAETVQAGVGATVLPHVDTLVDQAKQSARSALGPSTFDKEFQAGQRLSRAAAIDLALGVAPASSSPSPLPSPLGERLDQVAQLVADGLSNKQIGAKLFLSEHTVDSHIRAIMSKLGVNSRAQIAAWVASVDGRTP